MIDFNIRSRNRYVHCAVILPHPYSAILNLTISSIQRLEHLFRNSDRKIARGKIEFQTKNLIAVNDVESHGLRSPP